MHIRRRMTYASALIGLFAACTFALAFTASEAHAAPTLTGRANVDFAIPGAFSLPDDSIGRDVGLPLNAPLGTVSGWDMSWLRLFYDPATDVLYVGIQTFGIGGDADGDGDEGTTSAWLASVFGADLPVWDDTESFALMLDTDDNGTFDVIAGVPATGDVTTYTVAQFDGLTSLPGFAFGAPLGDEFIPPNPVVGPATFVAPHIEFRISSFSQLPGFNGTVGSFRAKVFMGSLEDSGIGEDRIPNGNDTAAQICFDSDGDGYSTCDGDCDDGNPGASPGNLGDPLCDLVDEDCDGKLDEDFGGPGVPTACGVEPACQAVGFLTCINGTVTDTCVPGDNGVFVPQPTTCGVGACAATGTTTCATGSVTDTCTPGTPAPIDGCNGIDDDCDGATDEGFVADVTTCGVGVCQRQGLTTCIAGVVADTCVAGEPAQFEVCNGLDDNCNGTTDDAPVLPNPPTCGLGECATTGTIACVGGQEVGTCVPPAGVPEICDGLDNDCNGDVDDNPSLPPAPTCGVGECATVGTVGCLDGEVTSECTPPTGVAEICDGLDNDCNGVSDDGIAPIPTTCGVGSCGAAGQLVCTGGGLVDTCVPGSPSAEVCDGADNNCNGSVDEGIAPTPTACGTGSCASTGELACVGGTLVDSCAPGAPSAEICDGADNDCNGAVDDGIPSTPTSCGVGSCAASGQLECTGGTLVDTCTAGTPSAEVCDGADNNCNGTVDEGIAPTPTACGTGACASTGELACVGGALIDSCAPGAPSAEICDGVDNNCNGSVDEGIPAEPTTCGVGACASTGELACSGGSLVDTCAPGNPSAEVCDGADNDCNGSVDDGIAPTPTTCGTGACASTGELVCTGGILVDTCAIGQPGAMDSCDGADNDCDGATDEDFVSEPTTCGLSGCASTGMTTCIGGVVGDSCVPGTPGLGDPICDGIDEDCDGTTDEDFGGLGNGTTCGSGVCASEGVVECINGQVIDTCVPGPVTGDDSDCDLVDNDCDASTDESFAGEPTACGIGACAGTGITSCSAGVISDSCTPGSPTGADDDCDGVDNDCDGATDESFVGAPTSCGTGVCAAVGTTVCVAGAVTDTCAAGTPTGGDADCDATDNDCDGSTDESFVSEPTSCGTGACAATGATTCTAGVIGNTCAPGSPTGGDADCDATDNDCDGSTDESFVSEPTSCGTGVCAATGATTCTAGVIGDSCAAGAPTGGDADCDATDNDCDGSTDESFVGVPTVCGTGACAATGTTTCSAGVIGDSCSPGSPTGGDADCDATDNDCDGSTDESFVSEPTSCGTGVCAATGATTCTAGVIGDSCAAGAPTGGDADCDTTDNDCDGSTDESFVGVPTVCGTGACAATGTTTCSAGVIGDSCSPGSPTGGDADCDATDNDCDGSTDESFASTPTTCGSGTCTGAGVLVCDNGTIVDTCQVTPGEPEVCNGADDNCNGEVDEGTTGVYYTVTQGGQAFQIAPVVGTTDVKSFYSYDAPNELSSNTGFEQSNRSVIGLYRDPAGILSLFIIHDAVEDGSGGEFAMTLAGLNSGTVVVQDDPSGAPDAFGNPNGAYSWKWPQCCTDGVAIEGIGNAPCFTISPGTAGGIGGIDLLTGGPGGQRVALDSQSAPFEICAGVCCEPDGGTDADCDGLDNDCDGETDESFVGGPTTCGVGACAGTGQMVCTNAQIIDTCAAGSPTGGDADCDATDNDCDGSTDESFVSDPTSCGTGACASTGMTTCTAGVIGDTCTAGTPGAADTCDGADNDCDGATDEDFVGTPTSCGTGVCASTGTTTCVAGVIGDTCTAGAPTGGDADCDATDNDCDGSTDESFVSDPTSCGTGVCASTGMTTCTAGVIGDTCAAGSPTGGDADCDATDNDCDGSTDESFVSDPTSCGTGACASTGLTTCTAGVIGDTCTAGTPGAADTCDGADNDCDGATDEDFVGTPTSCGTGVCASTGTTTCVAGVIGDTCTAGAPTGGDADCDATDNDCDGSTDESFAGTPTACGVGVCASTGMTTCTAGVIGDTCAAGSPTGGDADCDATDNDCDGSTDESFVSDPTSCGTGACASTGLTTCTAGVIGDTCTAGTPGAADTCDGADNDCDGATDEDFVGTPTSCGTGVCASTGTTTCVAGVIGDTCTAGAPTGGDADCDATDNDCDGSTDESFAGTPTACGVGVCASTGTTTCSAGVIGDTCAPGNPAGRDSVCNGLDDDCDGSVDEAFIPKPTSCGVGVCARLPGPRFASRESSVTAARLDRPRAATRTATASTATAMARRTNRLSARPPAAARASALRPGPRSAPPV
ncbi:MAG: MopE-related protein [Myxococcota bacterium]